jgi:transposase
MPEAYVRGIDREQVFLLPEQLEDYVGPNYVVRVIDRFVDGLGCGGEDDSLPVLREMSEEGGRKGFSPQTMTKLLMWGYLNQVRSTRQLERATYTNLEVIWLLGKLHPDHTSISRYRKAHVGRIKRWLRDFNRICSKLGLFGAEELVVDGAILKAVNSKANNYTQERLQKRLERQDAEIERYLQALELSEQPQQPDAQVELFPMEVAGLEEKLGELLTEQQETLSMIEQAKSSPTGQLSLVDPDARLLKKKTTGTAVVGYNAQSVVDSKHHLIAAVEVTQAPSDWGQLTSMLEAAREVVQPIESTTPSQQATDAPPIRALADGGYADFEDIAAAERAGFEPYVSLPQNSSAQKNGLFTLDRFSFDEAADCYRCPGGQQLHRHSDTEIRGTTFQAYHNVAACRECPLRKQCTKGAYRKIKRHPEQPAIDRVKQRMEQNPGVYRRRAATVEHPFGSMLFWNGGRNLLCRGLDKANAEFSLSALAYNIKRVLAVVGFATLMEAVG